MVLVIETVSVLGLNLLEGNFLIWDFVKMKRLCGYYYQERVRVLCNGFFCLLNG